jgi:hypothetical protein
MAYGANPTDWQQFVDQGLTHDLLPVVSDPSVPISKASKLRDDNRGKVPSHVKDGAMVGMPGWSRERHTAADVKRWMADDRLGVCIQTREIRAIDVDIADPTISADVRGMVELVLGHLPCRSRGNSGKLLLAFRLPGTYLKRIIETPHGRIEFLANGQHFVAAGTHPSGARYEWDDAALPDVTASELDAVWAMLAQHYGTPREERSTATHSEEVVGLTEDELNAVADALDPDMPYDEWCKVGMAYHHETRGEGLQHWIRLSSRGSEYPGDEELGYKWQTFGHYTGPSVTMKSVLQMAADKGVRVGPMAPASPDEFPDEAAAQAVEHQAKVARFTPVSFADFTSRPAPTWIVKGVLPKAGLVVLYGASGAGKSFIALDVVAAVARGVQWRGKRVRQGRVVYVAAEGVGGFRNRCVAYAKANGLEAGAMAALEIIADRPNLLTPNEGKTLGTAIGHADLVVVDTLAQVTPGANENAGEHMGKALDQCLVIHAMTGATVLLVHHSGKDAAKGARGWSGIRAAADAELEVERTPGGRVLRTTKQKDGDDSGEWGFELEVVNIGVDEDGDPITSCVTRETEVNKAKPVTRKLGPREQAVMDAFQVIAASQVEGIEVDGVLEEALARVDLEGKKASQVKSNLRSTLRRLLENAEFGIGQAEDGTLYVC